MILGACAHLTKATKLAAELLTETGIRCLRICALAGHTGYIRVTLGTIENRESQGLRLWFRSARAAGKVLDELHEIHGGRLSGDGVVMKANPDEVERLLRISADLLGGDRHGFAISDDAAIDALAASLTARVAGHIAKIGRHKGTMKALRPVVGCDLTGLLARQSM